MLILEDEEGHHQPVAVASTINEAKELAVDDLRRRMRRLERGDNPGLCPQSENIVVASCFGSDCEASPFGVYWNGDPQRAVNSTKTSCFESR
jgi:hypothetical protein